MCTHDVISLYIAMSDVETKRQVKQARIFANMIGQQLEASLRAYATKLVLVLIVAANTFRGSLDIRLLCVEEVRNDISS